MVNIYEQKRLQRMEENQRKMQQLNLNILALDIKKSPKPSLKAKRKTMVQKTIEFKKVRRSARNANKPAPVYRDVFESGIEKRTRKSAARFKASDSEGNYPKASEMERQIARDKADALALSLADEFPCTFGKTMRHSQVNSGFWLGLPSNFCKKYLPRQDTQVTLVNEEEVVFEITYLAGKIGLSGGWVAFAKYHNLVNGDACVFQLTKPNEFKVYIIRANGVSYGEESS